LPAEANRRAMLSRFTRLPMRGMQLGLMGREKRDALLWPRYGASLERFANE
jgi:hypothetical protein